MRKKFLPIMLSAIIIAAILCGVCVYANTPKIEFFTGINGEKITVYTNSSFPATRDYPTETNDVKLGDIIEDNGSQQIVIGVSDDDRFITMPLDDYKLEQ